MAKRGNTPPRGNATMTELRALDVRPVVVTVGRDGPAPQPPSPQPSSPPSATSSPPRGPVAEALARSGAANPSGSPNDTMRSGPPLQMPRTMTVIRPHGGSGSGRAPSGSPRDAQKVISDSHRPSSVSPMRALTTALGSNAHEDDYDDDEDIRTRKTVQELDARAALDALAAIDRAREQGRLSFPQLSPLAAAPAGGKEESSGVYYEETRRERGAPEREVSAMRSRPVWSTQAGRVAGAGPPPPAPTPPAALPSASAQPPPQVMMTVNPTPGRAAPQQPQRQEALVPFNKAPPLRDSGSPPPPRADLGMVRVNRVPLSGEPVDLRLFMQRRPDSPQAAAFRVLRYRVEQGQAQGTLVLAVSAAQPGQGTSTAAANLALALSECERARVCLVEGNLRRPALARMLRFRPPQCLVERLAQDRSHPLAAWDVAEVAPGLHVLAVSETAAPQALLDGPAFASCIESLRRSSYGYVVIDGPEVLGIADMNLIEEAADRVLLVARGGVTHAADLRRATAQLAGPKLMGAVLLDGEGS